MINENEELTDAERFLKRAEKDASTLFLLQNMISDFLRYNPLYDVPMECNIYAHIVNKINEKDTTIEELRNKISEIKRNTKND